MKQHRLRYISISHKSASLKMRERFHFSEPEKIALMNELRSNFNDIQGLLILITCNRTELYVESENTNAGQIRDFVMKVTFGNSDHQSRKFFNTSDVTSKAVKHMLEVSSGLASSVLGDAEIIHQIKVAYQYSCKAGFQGSLLERCMQTVFKTHKRISNETSFRDGTTSVAYKTLKLIDNSFESPIRDSLKILIVGAGDIVKQLLNYNNKFGFNSVYVSNRTIEKAEELTQKYGGSTYSWNRVLENDFAEFNVIVTAVSNRPQLVTRIKPKARQILLLDLAVPGNIDKSLADDPGIIHYDLDTIAKALKENHDTRMQSIKHVVKILNEELREFDLWLQNAPLREHLIDYKNEVNQWMNEYLKLRGLYMENKAANMAVNRIIRRSFKKEGEKIPEYEMVQIVEEHI